MWNIQKRIIKILEKKQPSTLNFLKNSKCWAVFSIFFFIPYILFAQIEITEIMYNPGEDENGSKADGGREWVEIYNSGARSVNLDGWKLVDKNGGHPLSLFQGNFNINPNNYVIIVKIVDGDDSTFVTDYPDFSGTILNSNFSLINKEEGDTIILKDFDSKVISQASYFPIAEANDNGNSFQKISGGNWGACSPTPGKLSICNLSINGIVIAENFLVENTSDELQDEDPPTTTASIPTTTSSSPARDFVEINIQAKIDLLEYFPVAGADFTFKGKALGLEGGVLENAIFQWSFGDGTKGEGQSVLHNFAYPGDYLIVMEVISGEYSRCDKLKIKVIPSEIIISSLKMSLNENFIEIHNPSNYEANLSWWRLRSDNLYFTLPKNTILLPKTYLKIPFSVTQLLPKENSIVQLLYPNGMLAFNYSRESVSEQKPIISVARNSEPLIVQYKEVPKTEKESLVYTVEKPASSSSLRGVEPSGTTKQSNENNLNNQTASINSVGVAPLQTGDTEKFKFPLNKWSFMLGGLTLIAVAGVGYATKLDVDNEKPF